MDLSTRVESFATALNESDVIQIYDALDDFVKICKTGEIPIADAYAKSSLQANEIFSVIDSAGKLCSKNRSSKTINDTSLIAKCFDALASILLTGTECDATKRVITKRLLTTYNGKMFSMLTTSKDNALVRSIFVLFGALVSQGASTTREVTSKIDFSMPLIVKHVSKGDFADGLTRYGSIRHRCFQLAMEILRNGDVNVKKRLIASKGFLGQLLSQLNHDPYDMQSMILETVIETILCDHSIGLRSKQLFFQHRVSHALISLFKLSEDSRALGKKFFHALVFDPKTSLYLGLAPKYRSNAMKLLKNLIAMMNPLDSEIMWELVMSILARAPDIISDYWNEDIAKHSSEPRMSFRWLKLMSFACQIIELATKREIILDVLPSVSRVGLSRGFQHASALVASVTMDFVSYLLQNWYVCNHRDSQLVQKLPDVNTLVTMLHADQTTPTIDIAERNWFRTRLMRTIFGYARIHPTLLRSKLDFGKLLRDSSRSLSNATDRLYYITVLECIDATGGVVIDNIEFLATLLILRVALRDLPNVTRVILNTIVSFIGCDQIHGELIECLLDSMTPDSSEIVVKILWECNGHSQASQKIVQDIVESEYSATHVFLFDLLHTNIPSSWYTSALVSPKYDTLRAYSRFCLSNPNIEMTSANVWSFRDLQSSCAWREAFARQIVYKNGRIVFQNRLTEYEELLSKSICAATLLQIAKVLSTMLLEKSSSEQDIQYCFKLLQSALRQDTGKIDLVLAQPGFQNWGSFGEQIAEIMNLHYKNPTTMQSSCFRVVLDKYLETPCEDNAYLIMCLHRFLTSETLALLPVLHSGVGKYEKSLLLLAYSHGPLQTSRLLELVRNIDTETEKVCLQYLLRIEASHVLAENFVDAMELHVDVFGKLWSIDGTPSTVRVQIVSLCVSWSPMLSSQFVNHILRQPAPWIEVLEKMGGFDSCTAETRTKIVQQLWGRPTAEQALVRLFDTKLVSSKLKSLIPTNVTETLLMDKHFQQTPDLNLLVSCQDPEQVHKLLSSRTIANVEVTIVQRMVESRNFAIVSIVLKVCDSKTKSLIKSKVHASLVDMVDKEAQNPAFLDVAIELGICDVKMITNLVKHFCGSLGDSDRRILKLIQMSKFSWNQYGYSFGPQFDKDATVSVQDDQVEEATLAHVLQNHFAFVLDLDFRNSIGKHFPYDRMSHKKRAATGSQKKAGKKQRKEVTEQYNELFMDNVSESDSESEADESSTDDDSSEDGLPNPSDAGVCENSSKCLNPSYVYDVLDQYFNLHLLVNTNKIYACFPVRKLIESGLVAYCIHGLSSTATMKQASTLLSKFVMLISNDESFRERTQVESVLISLANAASGFPIAPLIANFYCAALELMLHPNHFMYGAVNKFVLKNVTIDLHDVPMFYICFDSGSPKDRSWIIRLLLDGVNTDEDLTILHRRNVIPIAMSLLLDQSTEFTTQVQVLHLFLKIAEIGGSGVLSLIKYDIGCWIVNMLSSCVASDYLDGGEKEKEIVFLLSKLLYTVGTLTTAVYQHSLLVLAVTEIKSFDKMEEATQGFLLSFLLNIVENSALARVPLNALVSFTFGCRGTKNQELLVKFILRARVIGFNIDSESDAILLWLLEMSLVLPSVRENVLTFLTGVMENRKELENFRLQSIPMIHRMLLESMHRSQTIRLLKIVLGS